MFVDDFLVWKTMMKIKSFYIKMQVARSSKVGTLSDKFSQTTEKLNLFEHPSVLQLWNPYHFRQSHDYTFSGSKRMDNFSLLSSSSWLLQSVVAQWTDTLLSGAASVPGPLPSQKCSPPSMSICVHSCQHNKQFWACVSIITATFSHCQARGWEDGTMGRELLLMVVVIQLLLFRAGGR